MSRGLRVWITHPENKPPALRIKSDMNWVDIPIQDARVFLDSAHDLLDEREAQARQETP